MQVNFASYYSIAAGLCDAATGILLLFAPSFTLSLMGIDRFPSEPVYLQYIGAFVLSVGVSYFLPFLLTQDAKERRLAIEIVWSATAIVRLVVASFVTLQLLRGNLVGGWSLVACTDGLLGVLQVVLVNHWRKKNA
ncbi:MAG: hypothetical protein KDD69_03235 [Bdellovibrionales bacterium]|nr:hypothetical protein [Bdellovibrionales bacterium]